MRKGKSMKARSRTARTGSKPKKRPAAKTMGGKTTSRKAVSLVKLVGITLRLKEQNNHLQGLYAELGKLFYEQRTHRGAGSGHRRSTGMEGIAEKIREMRKNMDRMEREAKLLRNVV
jgi:hypothetical protein